jgi:hypothetical protein
VNLMGEWMLTDRGGRLGEKVRQGVGECEEGVGPCD